MSQVRIRPLTDDDLVEVLERNNAEVPAVGDLDRDRLAGLVAMAESALAAGLDGELAGFVIALPPGVAYTSPNYAWFSRRSDDFVYIDRIVVLPGARGRGVGRALYDAVVAETDAPLLLAEVNTAPRNDVSLAFHERYGFEPVGEAAPYGDDIRVVYLEKPLRAVSAQD